MLWDEFLTSIQEELDTLEKDFLRGKVISKTVCPTDPKLVPKLMQCFGPADSDIVQEVKDTVWGKPTLHEELKISLATAQTGRYIKLMKDHFRILPYKDINHIVDIGGGYGNMYRIMNRLGYKGKYQIIDFPIMHKLQLRYLEKTCSDISNLEQIDLDMEKAIPSGKSMLIATHSVNEMPLDTRKKIEPYYKNYDYLFFNHNSNFDGIDNIEYFKNLMDMLQYDYHIVDFNCPIHKSHWFKICQRK
jgi:hypothetical protein